MGSFEMEVNIPSVASTSGAGDEDKDAKNLIDEFVDFYDLANWSPLHHAAREGDLEDLIQILDHSVNGVKYPVAKNSRQRWRTPLMLAAEAGHIDCVQLLLACGANPELKVIDEEGLSITALHVAVLSGSCKCLELIASKVDLTSLIVDCHPDNAGKSDSNEFVNPVFLALEAESHACLELLLTYGFSPDSVLATADLSTGLLSPVDLGRYEPALAYAVQKEDKDAVLILFNAGAFCHPSSPHIQTAGLIHPVVRALDLDTTDMLNLLFELYGANFGRRFFEWHEVFLGSIIKLNRMKNLLLFGFNPVLYLGDDVPITIFEFATFVMTEHRCLVRKMECILQFVTVSGPIQDAYQRVIEKWKSDPTFEEEAWTEMLTTLSKPSPLKHIARMKIRHLMFEFHGPGFVRHMKDLPLPQCIQSFLAFDGI